MMKGRLAFVSVYVGLALSAKAQVIDTSSQVSDQLDNNVVQTLTTPTEQAVGAPPLMITPAPTSPKETALALKLLKENGLLPTPEQWENLSKTEKLHYLQQGAALLPQQGGRHGAKPFVQTLTTNFIYSGFTATTGTNTWKTTTALTQDTFNEKNSFIGKGLTDAYTSAAGWSFTGPNATTIQPFISYQTADTGLGGKDTFHSETYGASLNLSQKFLPMVVFDQYQPQATLNIGSSTNDPACPNDLTQTTKPDHYANCDMLTTLNLSFNDANTATLTAHHSASQWGYGTQDTYGIVPGLAFDYYTKQTSDKSGLTLGQSLIPAAITLAPSYTYTFAENQLGQSDGAGFLSVQDRNTYILTLQPGDGSDCDNAPKQVLQLTEINGIYHDTNQEFFTTPATHIEYQNWAQFGLSLTYVNKDPFPAEDKPSSISSPPSKAKSKGSLQAKIEYDYTAFNNQYEGHNVVFSLSVGF